MVESRGLLERLLKTPDLPQIVPRLQPEILHRVIQACGLEDCAEFVALATPAQLSRVIDADVWQARPGVDDAFDPERFGLWLTVLLETGAGLAAEKLAGLDLDLVIAGFAQHLRVSDYAAVAAYMTLDGEQVAARLRDVPAFELGGYRIEARRTSAWDAIVEILAFLHDERPVYFHRLMRGCVRASSGPREKDGFHDLLDDRAQAMVDMTFSRDRRREQRGYATAADARAFLQEGRALRLDGDRPPRSAMARAYFQTIESPGDGDDETTGPPDAAPPSTPEAARREAAGVAAVFEVLEHAGVITNRPRALIGAGDQPAANLSFIQAHAALHAASEEEVAYLANTIVAGCSIQGRPFTVREASDCAAALCNLGLEHWPSAWAGRDLITAFQIGLTIVHRDVCMYAAKRLIEILAAIGISDRDIHLRLDGLRSGLIRHTANREPWHVSDALDVILTLDASAWAGLVGLIAECPVIHGAVSGSRQSRLRINPTDFEFVSHSGQIETVREFLAALPSLLTR